MLRFIDKSIESFTSSTSVSAFKAVNPNPDDDPIWCRAEIDSHANMCVLGRHCLLLTEPGARVARVRGFSPDMQPLDIPIVDALLSYIDPIERQSHLLKFENVLYVPSMNHHLVSPFVLREAGFKVNDVPCIHTHPNDLSEETHCIVNQRGGVKNLKIHLDLHGVFSFFWTSKPDKEEMMTVPLERQHVMTPNYEWDPNKTVYAEAEYTYRDDQGNIRVPTDGNFPSRDKGPLSIFDMADRDIMTISARSLKESELLTGIAKAKDPINGWSAKPGSAAALKPSSTQIVEYNENGGAIIEYVDQEDASTSDDSVPDRSFKYKGIKRSLVTMHDYNKKVPFYKIAQFEAGDYRKKYRKVEDASTSTRSNAQEAKNDDDDGNDATIASFHVDLMPEKHGDVPFETEDPVMEGLVLRQAQGQISMAVGSTSVWNPSHLFEDDEIQTSGEVSSLIAKESEHATAERLSKAWNIDYDTAKDTLSKNSMYSPRNVNKDLSRNISTNDRAMRYKHLNDNVFMDTMFATKKALKSSRGNTCAQIIVTDKGYIGAYPMKTKGDAIHSLKTFCKDVGIPIAVICDPSGEQSSNSMKTFIQDVGSRLRLLEQGTQWANRAELVIGQLKSSVRSTMKTTFCPLKFWDYCLEWHARISNMTPKNLFQLRGETPFFTAHGREGDISNLATFGFYEWVYFKDVEDFPLANEVLGRYLGPTDDVGSEMTSWILKSNGKVVPRRTVRPLKDEEIRNEQEKKKRELFEKIIVERHGTYAKPDEPLPKDHPLFDFFNMDDDMPYDSNIPEADELNTPPVDASGNEFDQQPIYDKLLSAEVTLPHGNEYKRATVLGRSLDADGRSTGTYSENPYLNTIIYDVLFPDGAVKQYNASIIAENMYSQVDMDGFQYNLMEDIVDHKRESCAIDKQNMYWKDKKTGKRHMRKTTIGWKLKVLWKDGTEQWIPLKDLKESNPIEVAEYSKAAGISDEPAFCWWVPYAIKKRDKIVSAVKARVKRTTHKYGVEIPTSVTHALELDKKNGNTFWRDAIRKEMTNVGIAFDIIEDDEQLPVGYAKATGHIIFDVKMDFTRKARWVLDGHKCEKPDISTYAGVVSRESVRIAFTYAALNGLDVFAADIQNAYLQAPTSVKHYIICGPEFGTENEGKRALIVRALYGGKTAGRDFRNYLRECMAYLGFTSCKADPDVWMRKAIGKHGNHWEYVLLYTDDALVVAENPNKILREEIGKYFKLKENSIGPPKIYLGGKVRKVRLENGNDAWGYSSSQYVQNAVNNVEEHLKKNGQKLNMRGKSPITSGYRPEVDLSPPLDAERASYYQSLIGILRWIVELGRVDICCEVSLLSSQLAMPREGHLEQLFHIFAYLKRNHNAEMVYDPSDPLIDINQFEERDWSTSEMGFEEKEQLPENAPEPRGVGVSTRAYVDADHAGDLITRRSRTGFLIYIMNAPIYWLSKKQTSVETSSFGSEFVAM